VTATPGRPGLERLRLMSRAASGEAVAALGRLAGIGVAAGDAVAWPDRAALAAEALEGLGQDALAVGIRMEGLLAGDLLLALPELAARRLAAALGQPVQGAGWGELAESALMESGNIVGSAFVSDVARRVRAQLLPSVPRLARGRPRECVDALAGTGQGPVVVTPFSAEDRPGLEGLVLVMLEAGSLPRLLAALDFGAAAP
jgi:chemotaxis protein CheC